MAGDIASFHHLLLEYGLDIPQNMMLLSDAAQAGESGQTWRHAVIRGDPPAGGLWVSGNVLQLTSPSTPEQAALLARRIHEEGEPLLGVYGMLPGIRDFAGAWCACFGCAWQIIRTWQLYAKPCVQGQPTPGLRPAAETEIGRLTQWLYDMLYETLESPLTREAATERIREEIALRRLYVLDVEGLPVSMAYLGRQTARCAYIQQVYTPPGERGRGYAGRLVDGLCAMLDTQGIAATCLHTDPVNQRAMRVYERIGMARLGTTGSIGFI